MRNLIPFFNHEIKKKLENQLQIEESGSKFATIQGKLAGFCSMFCILNDIEEDNLLTIKEEKEKIHHCHLMGGGI